MPVDNTNQPTVARNRSNRGKQHGKGMPSKKEAGGKYKKGRPFTSANTGPAQQKGFKPGEIDPKAPKTPDERIRKGPICGAARTGNSSSGPGVCCQPAGWGTPHPGTGHCKHHGGCLPAQVRQAETERAQKHVVMFGADRTIDPQLALLEEVQRTAGHVDYLRDLIQQFDDKTKLTQFTEAGIEPAVWVRMYQDERNHLVKVCEAAIKCGVAERQVRIAEEQGRLMAMVLMAFIHDPDLNLDSKQMSFAPKLIRKHLTSAPLTIQAEELPEQVKVEKTPVIDV
jgi:hypothetical protein